MTLRRLGRGTLYVVSTVLIGLWASSCADDKNPTNTDTTAPGAIVTLATSEVTSSSIRLSWTATGDDGGSGTARSYDIRYSQAVITGANFSGATAVTGIPTPTASGTNQTVNISGLAANTMYHFAMKSSDEVPNPSSISNLPSATTLNSTDVLAPAMVTDLSTDSLTPTSVRLTWTAPGDDLSNGTASQYDVRYSTNIITAANFTSATAIGNEPVPTVAGTVEHVTITGLVASTTYYFAMKSADEVPNWSVLSNLPNAVTAATPDVTAPMAITDLVASPMDPSRVVLTWTAPGDDNGTGSAEGYDIRYSTSAITEALWSSATQVVGEPNPAVGGETQVTIVSGLNSATHYFFAIKTWDEVPNSSAISNISSTTTQ